MQLGFIRPLVRCSHLEQTNFSARAKATRFVALPLALGIAVVFALPARAVDRTWTGTTGDFGTAANWNPAGVPTAADSTFVNSGTSNITSNQATFDCNAGNVAASTGTYTQTGASTTLSVNSWFRYGTVANATGTFNLNGGTLNTSPTQGGTNLNLGEATGGTGNLNLNGGTFNANNSALLRVGLNGTGTLAIASGAFNMNSTGFTSIGLNAGSTGVMTISGGSFNNLRGGDFNVGDVGTGTLNVSGTGLLDTGTAAGLLLSRQAASRATVNLDGGTISTRMVRKDAGTAASVFNFNGGTLRALQSSGTFMSTLNTTSGALTANVRNGGAIFDTNGFSDTIAVPLLHSSITGDNALDGGVIKNGIGVLTLSGVGTYTGGNIINGGTLSGTSDSIKGNTLTNANTVLGFNQTTVGTYTGAVSGDGALVKNGTGRVTLSGAIPMPGEPPSVAAFWGQPLRPLCLVTTLREKSPSLQVQPLPPSLAAPVSGLLPR